ncbi:MAG: lipopolysaccharide heptosyltransferase II [Thermodesulfobacteriota bacterium]|nr:lipopolysaccharide heptosyltransferase II [Thermodesulfobacteriota bacterium]
MQKIVVRGTNWIGDVVMSLPFYEGMKEAWPGTDIYVLTRPHLSRLYACNSNIKGIITINEDHRAFGWARAIRQIRAIRPDCIITLPHSFSSALFSFFSGTPVRYGRACHYRSVFFTSPVYGTIEGYPGHQADFYMEMLQAITGYRSKACTPWIHISQREMDRSAALLNGIKTPILGLFTSAAYGMAKIWPRANFIDLAKRYIDVTNGSVVLFGSKADIQYNETIKGELDDKCYNLAGRSDILETVALMKRCAVVVANDSGPMHLGAASGTRTIGIFGSTNPERTAPRGGDAHYIYKDLECAPCMEHTCRYGTYDCLKAVTPSEVLDLALGH